MKVEFLKKIFISKKISADLALRDNVIKLFEEIKKSKDQRIIIDFSNVNTITRSFADEYLKRRKQIKKEIVEQNVPSNISKMFEIIKKVNNLPSVKSI